MKKANKSTLNSIMIAALNAHKTARDEVEKIYQNIRLSDAGKAEKALAAGKLLRWNIETLRENLRQEREKELSELNIAKRFNSDKRLSNTDYQRRLMLEAEFIRSLPDSMGQDVLKDRLSVFYGDERARQFLSAVLNEASDKRKSRGVEGFTVSEILPDIYGLQTKAIEKIYSAIDSKLSNISEGFISLNAGDAETTKNEKDALFMQGLFTGISEYIDSLPDEMERPDAARIHNVDYERIPAYALTGEDLNINFSMYRNP